MHRALHVLSAAAMVSSAATAFGEVPRPLARIALSTIPEAPAHAPPASGRPEKVTGSVDINSAAPISLSRADRMDGSNSASTPWMNRVPQEICVTADSQGLVRMERLIPPGDSQGTPLLEVRHVKASTRTLKEAETIPLVLVASAVSERVYAYRDDDNVHLIWTLPDTPRDMRWSDARSQFNATNCGHAHLLVSIRDANTAKASALGAAPVPPVVRTVDKPTPPREIRLSASLTQSSRDREPLLSVALAYGERDNRSSFQLRAMPDGAMMLEGPLE